MEERRSNTSTLTANLEYVGEESAVTEYFQTHKNRPMRRRRSILLLETCTLDAFLGAPNRLAKARAVVGFAGVKPEDLFVQVALQVPRTRSDIGSA